MGASSASWCRPSAWGTRHLPAYLHCLLKPTLLSLCSSGRSPDSWAFAHHAGFLTASWGSAGTSRHAAAAGWGRAGQRVFAAIGRQLGCPARLAGCSVAQPVRCLLANRLNTGSGIVQMRRTSGVAALLLCRSGALRPWLGVAGFREQLRCPACPAGCSSAQPVRCFLLSGLGPLVLMVASCTVRASY